MGLPNLLRCATVFVITPTTNGHNMFKRTLAASLAALALAFAGAGVASAEGTTGASDSVAYTSAEDPPAVQLSPVVSARLNDCGDSLPVYVHPVTGELYGDASGNGRIEGDECNS